MNHITYYKLLSKAAIPFYKAIERIIVRSQEFLNSSYLCFPCIFWWQKQTILLFCVFHLLNLFWNGFPLCALPSNWDPLRVNFLLVWVSHITCHLHIVCCWYFPLIEVCLLILFFFDICKGSFLHDQICPSFCFSLWSLSMPFWGWELFPLKSFDRSSVSCSVLSC